MAEQQGFFSGVMSPEETELAIDREILGKNPGAAEVIGGFLGKALGGGGYQKDPRMQKAAKMQELQTRVSRAAQEKGISINDNPEEFTKLVAAHAWDMGLPDVGFEALKTGRKMSLERRKQETEEDRSGTYAASVEATERIATAHDKTNLEIAKLNAAAKAGADGKNTPFKFATANLSKNMQEIFQLDPELEQFMDNLGDTVKIMGDDAADIMTKLARDNPDSDPEEIKNYSTERIKARLFTKGGFFSDTAVYYRTPEQVRTAYKKKEITRDQAARILSKGFDFKDK